MPDVTKLQLRSLKFAVQITASIALNDRDRNSDNDMIAIKPPCLARPAQLQSKQFTKKGIFSLLCFLLFLQLGLL